MSTQTTVLITGANRGIGQAVTATYLNRPHHTIIALVRDLNHSTSLALSDLPKHSTSNLITLPYDGSSPTSAESAISTLTATHPNISHISIVIANAGFNGHMGPSLEATPETYIAHYTVNTLAPLLLFKACLPLMLPTAVSTTTSTSTPSPPAANPATRTSATSKPLFIAISSGTGSTTRLTSQAQSQPAQPSSQPRIRTGALPYTSSKCALNHIMVKLSVEYPEVRVGIFTPGPTRTGLGGGLVDWEKIKGMREVGEVVVWLVQEVDGMASGEGEGEQEDGVVTVRDISGRKTEW